MYFDENYIILIMIKGEGRGGVIQSEYDLR